jgi:hypothetical protein
MTTQTSADPRDEIIETQKRVINFEREKNIHLQRKLQWYEEMHSQKELPQNARLAGIALKKIMETSTPDKNGWIRGDLGTMAKATGVSSSTSSRGVHCLADNTDAIELRVEKHPYDPQQEILFFRAKESFDSPPEITITGEIKRHGGNRRCHCGGHLVEKQRTLRRQRYLQCEKCHEIARIYKAEDTENREWPATPFQDETVDMTDESPFQDETVLAGENELPFQDETVSDASEGGVSPLQNDDSITIQVPPADCNAPLLSASDIESQAAQLLKEIAGTHPKHIKMCKSGAPKYVTLPTVPTLEDMIAHIRGHETIGAHIRHPFGRTRALCYDADTPEKWGLCLQAARLLAIVGIKVILEPSPATGKHQGGGHMWIIFDRLVDAYSARQTMLQYAPELAQIAEYWPVPEGGNRVRLPGGKYVGAGISAWCTLTDAYGVELSHDGAGAALVLLDYQTPSTLVNTYQKPAPALQLHSEEKRQATPPGGVSGKTGEDPIMQAINDSFSWDELARLCGGFDRRDNFPAMWRGSRPPNDVHVFNDTDRAVDFGDSSWLGRKPMDKYQVWCFIQAGKDWEAFRKSDLAERCRQMRKKERAA